MDYGGLQNYACYHMDTDFIFSHPWLDSNEIHIFSAVSVIFRLFPKKK